MQARILLLISHKRKRNLWVTSLKSPKKLILTSWQNVINKNWPKESSFSEVLNAKMPSIFFQKRIFSVKSVTEQFTMENLNLSLCS